MPTLAILRPTVAAFVLSTLLCALPGCRRSSPATDQAQPAQRAEGEAELESQREQMQQISLPTKSRYMAIHGFSSWENPYLTVQPGMVELHITLGDANTSTLGAGGMLRPIGARRQVLNLSMDKLREAISSVPASAWPYGRVIALEGAHNTPAAAEPAVRRNMEAAIAQLNDLGVVVYDPSEGKIQ